jgi:transposase InsO family protein
MHRRCRAGDSANRAEGDEDRTEDRWKPEPRDLRARRVRGVIAAAGAGGGAHAGRGVQYLSIAIPRLAEAGIEPSVGSRGHSYDNALAETIIGLFKTEVIRQPGPWRGHEDVEFATLKWVWWLNHHRLLEPLGYMPPVEYEEAFYRAQEAQASEPVLN